MEKKAKNSSLWTEVGYELFANEGMDGVQVERLARIVQLNKSGFYHYFGDLEVFCNQLLKLHAEKAKHYLEDIAGLKSIDPGYLQAIVKHKVPIMFHIQLVRITDNQSFQRIVEKIDQQENVLLHDVWTEYIGFHDNPDLAIRYFSIVRDMFYTRLSLQNMNYESLHYLMSEARDLMQQIVKHSAMETDESIF